MLLLAAPRPGEAWTQVPPPRPAPACADTPDPDPVRTSTWLPTHKAIASYLGDTRNPASLDCTSQNYRYEGRRDGVDIRVTSYHLQGGREHTTYAIGKRDQVGGGVRHGIATSAWPDGQPQSVEYYCEGFEVGFHRYYDQSGRLSLVVDYTKSDLEFAKPLGHKPSRRLRTPNGSSMAGDNLFSDASEAQRFREVYDVTGGNAAYVGFGTAPLFGNWALWQPGTSLARWTTQGDQGEVRPLGRWGANTVWLLHNAGAWLYVPFGEAYQRDRAGAAGLRAPDRIVAAVLRCPWLDEAMKPPTPASVFQASPLRQITDDERAATPEARYAACLAQPRSECFLRLAYEQLMNAGGSGPDRDRTEFVRMALALDQPEMARDVAAAMLVPGPGFRVPNPVFAEAAALKAQAEIALGQDATSAVDAAFEHAMTRLHGYDARTTGEAIMAIMPVIARVGDIGRLRALYDSARNEPNRPFELGDILVEIGLLLARRGDAQAVAAILDELTPLVRVPGPNEQSLPPRTVNAIRAIGGSSIMGLLPVEAKALSLAALLDARVARRDDTATRRALDDLAPVLATNQVKGFAAREGTLATIRAHAALGEMGRAHGLAEAAGDLAAEAIAELAIAACERGHRTEALAALGTVVQADKHNSIAALAKAEALCGRTDRARAEFERALEAARRVSNMQGGAIGNFAEVAIAAVRRTILEAGLVDMLDTPFYGDGEDLRARIAARRAKLGDRDRALADIERLAIGFADVRSSPDPSSRDTLAHEAIVRARAEILARAGRVDDAKVAYADAARRAFAYDHPLQRGLAFAMMAQVQLELRDPATRTNLRLARQFLDLQKLSGPPVDVDVARTMGTWIVQAFAELGEEAEASATQIYLVETTRPSFAIDARNERGRQRILAALAAETAARGDLRRAEELIDGIGNPARRLVAWLDVRDRLRQHNDVAVATVQARLRNELQDVPAVFNATWGSRERAAVVSELATVLSTDPDGFSVPPETALARIKHEADLVQDRGQRAAALCRLGGVATKLGLADFAFQAFAEVVDMAQDLNRHHPHAGAAGYCAGVMTDGGEAMLAAPLVDSVINRHRASLGGSSLWNVVPEVYALSALAHRYASFERRRFLRVP